MIREEKSEATGKKVKWGGKKKSEMGTNEK